MPFAIYATLDGPPPGRAPMLIVANEAAVLPPHPEGHQGCWVMTSSEEASKALVGRGLLRSLAAKGQVITPLPLESLLRVRSPAFSGGTPVPR